MLVQKGAAVRGLGRGYVDEYAILGVRIDDSLGIMGIECREIAEYDILWLSH